MSNGRSFSLRYCVQPGSVVHPLPSPRVPGILNPGLKWPGREADQLSVSSADVKNVWSYTFTLPHVFMA